MGTQPARDKRAVAMRSPINWMVLGLIIERPSYGYELGQRFERDYGDLVRLGSDSQVYTALNALAEKCLIEEVSETELVRSDVGRQPKPAYRATPSGIEAYRAWLVTQIHEERRHAQLFTRQLAGFAQREPRAALAIVKSYEEACLNAAAQPIASTNSSGESVSRLRTRLAREEAVQFEEARLSLARLLRQELVALLDATPRRR